MAKKILFMTETELMDTVNQATEGTGSSLGFSEEWEMDTIRIPVSSNQEKLNQILDTFIDKVHIQITSTDIVFPVNSFIPTLSESQGVSLLFGVDVCECNLYEEAVLYAFIIA